MEQNTALTTFEFQGNPIRVIMHKGGFWFVGNEACAALGIANPWDAISRLSPHQKDDLGITDAIGRIQRTKIVSEGGLYKLAFRSHKPEAEAFTDKVVDEVLPSIRKTGTYSLASDHERVPASVIAALDERMQHLEQEVEALKQVGQSCLKSSTRKQLPANAEETSAKVTKRVLVFLQRQEEPVSRRTILTYGHFCVATIEPILDELVARGQVSRIKTPGSRVQWFYRLEDTGGGREMVQRDNQEKV